MFSTLTRIEKIKKEAKSFILESYQYENLDSGHVFSYKIKGIPSFTPGLRHGTCVLRDQENNIISMS